MAAVPLHLTGPSCLHSKIGVSSPQASLSCATKVFTGLKSQSQSSTSLFNSSTPNLTDEFHKGLQIRSRNKRAGGRVWLLPMGPPMVPYKTPGEDSYQWIELSTAFYRERVIFIGQVIDDDFSNIILSTLLFLDTLGFDEPMYLYINSPGGDLTPCLALYDTMLGLQTRVGTYCLNLAGDMAGFILAAGEKGNRISMPLGKVELRAPMGSGRGQADDVLVETEELSRIRDYLFNQLAKHTGQPVEKVYEDLSRTKRFRVREAIAYGIIDRCVKRTRIPTEELEPPKDDSAARKEKRKDKRMGIH